MIALGYCLCGSKVRFAMAGAYGSLIFEFAQIAFETVYGRKARLLLSPVLGREGFCNFFKS